MSTIQKLRLSPLNLSGPMAREFGVADAEVETKAVPRKSARLVTAYACPICESLHTWEDDAEECCQGEATPRAAAAAYQSQCPVCAANYETAEDASDCCLWKDLDLPTRHAMAAKVQAGSTWARELGIWPATA